MAIKITDLSNYTTPANADVLPIVDTSSGVTKKIRADVLVGAFLPTGITVPYAGATEPDGWFLCNGQAIDRTSYADLFTLIGTTYGVGDGSTTFNVPDLRGKTIVGKSAETEFLSLGTTGGAKTVTLSIANLPAHTHTGTTSSVGNHTHDYYAPSSPITVKAINTADTALGHVPTRTVADTVGAGAHSHTFTTASTGSGSSVSILSPYMVQNWIIKT